MQSGWDFSPTFPAVIIDGNTGVIRSMNVIQRVDNADLQEHYQWDTLHYVLRFSYKQAAVLHQNATKPVT